MENYEQSIYDKAEAQAYKIYQDIQSDDFVAAGEKLDKIKRNILPLVVCIITGYDINRIELSDWLTARSNG